MARFLPTKKAIVIDKLSIETKQFENWVKMIAERDNDQRYAEDPLLFMSIAYTIFEDLMSFAATDRGQAIIARIVKEHLEDN